MKLERIAHLPPTTMVPVIERNFRRLETELEPYVVAHDYTFLETNQIDSLQVNAGFASITITLPSPTGNRRYRVSKMDSGVNTVTVDGNGYLINGSTTVVLAAQYDFVWIEPTKLVNNQPGNGWLIIGS